MIKANELMGNLVYVDNEKHHSKLKNIPLKVIGVSPNINYGITTHAVQLEHINQNPNTYYQTYSQFIKYIKAIPLTEENIELIDLELWGFVGFGTRKIYQHNIFKAVKFELLPNDQIAIYFNGELINYKSYFHEFQNFYFTLTSEELIIK